MEQQQQPPCTNKEYPRDFKERIRAASSGHACIITIIIIIII
jgi:hypothetical protein